MDIYEISFLVGLIIGALLMGTLLGLLPLILGIKRGKVGLGVAGIIACIVGHFIWGLFVSIPVSIIFAIVILILSRKKPEEIEEAESQQF